MKKIFTLFTILFVAVASQAQPFEEGAIMLGGSVGYSRQTVEIQGSNREHYNSISLNPTVSKFYRTNRSAGINLFINSTQWANENKNRGYGAGVFLRQYVPLGKAFYVFAEEGAAFNNSRYEQPDGTNEKMITRQNAVRINFFPGLAYQFNKYFLMELALNNLVSLGYSSEKRTTAVNSNNTSYTNRSFTISTGAADNSLGNFSVGARWILH